MKNSADDGSPQKKINIFTSFKRKNKSGYLLSSNALNRGVSIILSMVFIILSSPAAILLIPFILLINGRPVLYMGDRYGLGKRIFKMYKFRTLPIDFENKNNAMLVSPHHKSKLPWFNQFLRDSRLDELPQLINILKGDMDFIGPRPLRPSVYNTVCKQIKNYDKRFLVNPGLIGYSQLFTPHSTPKRIRSFIDNKASKIQRGMIFDFIVVFIAIFAVVYTCIRILFRGVLNFVDIKLLKTYISKRGFDRIRQNQAHVSISHSDTFEYGFSNQSETCGCLVDINEEYFRVDSNEPIEKKQANYIITTMVKTRVSRLVSKSAYCHGEIYQCYENLSKDYKYSYIIKYSPVSALNQYFVDQYFLKKSLMRYVF